MSGLSCCIALCTLAAFGTAACAKTYYVAPPGLDPSQRASGAARFASLTRALTSGTLKGGDVILLADGNYGRLELNDLNIPATVTIRSQHARKAHFESIQILGATSDLRFENISVWPSNPSVAEATLIIVSATSARIAFDGLDVRSGPDAESYLNWSATTWNQHKFSGFRVSGPDNAVTNSHLFGVYMGITATGDNALVRGNLISGYNGDGLRGLGNNNVFRNNRVINCVDTDANHDDGFQSFASASGPIVGLVLDGNQFLEWVADPSPLRCALQGIGLFDGFYDDLTIINNVVSTSQYHGISVYGARHALIANNTVVNAFGNPGTTPYLAVRPHKNKTPSSDVLVVNNIAMSIQGAASAKNRVVFLNNSTVVSPLAEFENARAFDYRLRPDSSYVDTGDTPNGAKTDITGIARPRGKATDRGAYEY